MSNLIRGIRSSVRSHTPDGESEKLVFHLAVSAMLGILTVAVARIFNHTGEIIDNIGLLIRFVGTIFALLFTILAIILTFQGQYSENRAIKELQRTGHYRSIFKRFYLSVFSVGVLFILAAAIGVFGIYEIDFLFQLPIVESPIHLVEVITVFFIASVFALTVLRMTTCFIIYYRIENIMREYNGG